MGDTVIRRADQARSGGHQLIASFAQFLVRIADLQAEVVHPDPPAPRDGGRILPDRDQEQLVVGPARGERRGRKADLLRWHGNLLPAQHISIEAARAVEVADVQHQVSQLFDLHVVQNSRARHDRPNYEG